MKVLLFDTNTIQPRIAPLGLEYLAEHLRESGHEVRIADSDPDALDSIECSSYDLIGLGVRNIDNIGFQNIEFYLPAIRDFVTHIRHQTNAPIVIGGTAVNMMPNTIREFTGVNSAVIGKGFRSIDCLIEMLQKGTVSPTVEDQSDYVRGYFKRNLIPHLHYEGMGSRVGIATKFGCPFNCSYCSYPLVDGHGLRERGIEEVVYEISNLRAEGVRNIFFADANFNVSARHAVDVLMAVRQKGLDINWEGFINPHPQAFTPEFFQEVVRSGKETVTLGVDTLSQRSLILLSKGFTLENIERAIGMCQMAGISVNLPILFGHPSESKKDVIETFKNIDRLRPQNVDIVIGIRLYPGTPLYYKCLSDDIIGPNQSLLEPFYLPIQDTVREQILVEIKARPNCHLSSPESLEIYRPKL